MTATAGIEKERVYPLALKGMTRVALVGPDGVGKSTVIRLVEEWVTATLPGRGVEVRRWRPALLPDLHAILSGKILRGKSDDRDGPVTPRRQPGPFHAIRILYYLLDFILGGWWLDRVRSAPGSIIIYDRCALDMQVDPVRFALKSDRGTKLLYRLAPKPDLVILLEDTPERVYSRKIELQPHEIREQYERWRVLAEKGIVHAIVRVDGPPESIAGRVRQLLLEAIDNKFGQAERPVYDEPSLDWIANVLDEGRGHKHRFAALPAASKPRVLIPLTSRHAASHGLRVYQPQRAIARFFHRLLSAGLQAGLVPLRPRVSLAMDGLISYLREVTGCPNATVSIALGTPRAHRKPVLQVMRRNGALLAFAKVGWNRQTCALVRQESVIQEKLANTRFSTAIVPAILAARPFGSRFVEVQAAAQGPLRKSPLTIKGEHLAFLRELHAQGERTPWSVRGIHTGARLDQIRRLGFHYYAHLIETAFAELDRFLQGEAIPTGMGHGDFSPWNIVKQGEKLVVFDWEYASPDTPPGWDLFHFLIVTAVEIHYHDGARLYRDLMKDGPNYFSQLEIRQEWFRPLLLAYVADMLSRLIIIDGYTPSKIDKDTRMALGQLLSLLVAGGTR